MSSRARQNQLSPAECCLLAPSLVLGKLHLGTCLKMHFRAPADAEPTRWRPALCEWWLPGCCLAECPTRS